MVRRVPAFRMGPRRVLLTALLAASPLLAFAQRSMSFQITVQEPRAGFVRQAFVDLECQGAACPGNTTLTLTRSGNVFQGAYTVPDTVKDVTFTPYVRFVVDNPAFPNVGWRTPNRAPMKFTDPGSPTYRTYPNSWTADFRELTVRARYWDGETWVHAQPNVLVRGTMPVQNRVVPAAMIREAEFVQGSGTIVLPFGDHFLSPGTPLEVEGRLGVTMPDPDGNMVNTQLIQMERSSPAFGAANEARLDFYSLAWLVPLRREMEGSLIFAGVPNARAISQVEFLVDPNQNGAEWRQERLRRDVWYETTRIALGPNFDHKVANSGDTLLHEWTHEIAYRARWQAAGTLPDGRACPTGHSFGQLCPCEWMGWEEGVNHFAGSHLLGRALQGVSDLRVGNGASWLDTDGDIRRGAAQAQMAECARRMQGHSPGSWIEDVTAGALIELYRAEGFDTEGQPLQALRAFVADWGPFAGQYGAAERTTRHFFLYKRANVNSPVPRVDARVVDQIGLWYLITTRQDVQALAPIEQLVPVRLETTTPTVPSAQPAAFRVSVRAFHRLVGQYRGYAGNSIRVHLVENGTQVGPDAHFAADATNPAFNFAAQIQNAWTNDTDKPVEHRVRAEVWGNFIDGQTDEVLGRSDEVVVTVEGKADPTKKPPPPSGALSITVKPEVMATEIFEAKLNIPPELSSKVAEWSWYAGGYSSAFRITDKPRGQEGPVLSFQYENPSNGKSGPATVFVVLRDANGREVGTAKQEIQFKSVSFAGSAPDVWDVNQHPMGMNMKRKPQEHTQPNGYKASVTGSLDLKWCQHFCPKTMAELEDRVNKDCGGWGRTEKRPIAIGNFKGFVLETKGVSSRAYVNAYMTPQAECGASGMGLLMYGQVAIEVSFGVSGGGVDDKDIPFLQAQGEAAWGEIHAILGSLSIVPDGKIAFTPYTGPKPTDVMPTVKLVLTPDKTKLRKGDVVDVTAVVENTRAEDNPIAYTWNGDHEGSGASVRFHALKPGKFTLSVAVGGARFPIGTVAKEFEVEALTAAIEKRSPPGDTIPFGADAAFAARVLSNGQPVQGVFTFRWEPHPDVTWQPHEGTTPQANASFPRPGRVRVWVSVLEQSGGVLETVAEAQPLEFTVGLPKFSIAFDPPSPYVGQPTKAKVVLEGQVPQDRIEFNWEFTNNGRPQTPTQGVREVTFVPRDRNKITVVVRARVPHYGDDLGSATGSVTAQAYNVTAKVLGPAGPPPPGFELVGKPGAIAAGQVMRLHADISPEPPSQPRFLWFAQNGVVDTPEAGKEASAHKSEPGTCQVKVRVEDQEQNTLGEAFTSFDVTVSKEEIETAKKKKALEEKLAQVKALVQAGKFEEAVAAAEEADAIDREGAWPTRKELIATLKNLGKEATSRRDWAAARRFYSLAVRLDRLDNEAFIGLNNIPALEKSDREVRAWAAEAEQLISQGRLASAEPKIESIKLWEQSLPPPMCPPAQAVIQRFEQALVGYRAVIAEAKAKWNDYFRRRDWEPALAMFRDLQRRELFKDDENWVGAMLDAIPKLAAEDAQKKAQAAQLKAEGEALLSQGRGQDAIGKFKQSLGYWPDPALDARVKELEARLARAQELAREGWACDQKNDLVCAISKYEEAQRALPNPQIAERIQQLKARLAQQQAEEQQRKARAKQLFGEGQACENKGDLPCAIGKYEEALRILPDEQLAAHVRDLRSRLAQQQEEENRRKQRAAQLYAEGQACESRGELACAIAKYEEAVRVLPNDQLSAHIRDLRARLQAAEQENQRKLRARQLVEEGQACENRGDIRCAIAKYEAAVAILPNPQVSERIRVLKARLAQPPPPNPSQNPASPPKSLSTGNTGGVRNGPTAPTTFRITSPARLVSIKNYHWNNGRGATPGSIGARSSDGATYGPWPASGLPGQGGVVNASWKVSPNVDLPPGTYTVVDSDPSTWACNDQSGGRGMSDVKLTPLGSAGSDFAEIVPTGASQPPPSPPTQPPPQPPTQPPPTSTSGVDIAGDWTVMGSFDLRIAGDGTSYTGTLLSVTPGMAEIHFKPGDTVLKLTRASAHTFKGERMQRTDDGTPSWKACSIGEEAGVLYLGLDVREGDPADGMVYARRK